MKKLINTENIYRKDNIKRLDRILYLKVLKRIDYVNKIMIEKGKVIGNLKWAF